MVCHGFSFRDGEAPWIGTADKRRAIKEFGTYYYYFSGCLDLVTVLISSLSSLVCRFFVVSTWTFHMGFCGLLAALAFSEAFESSTPPEVTKKYSTMPRGENRREPGRELRDDSRCTSVLRMQVAVTCLTTQERTRSYRYDDASKCGQGRPCHRRSRPPNNHEASFVYHLSHGCRVNKACFPDPPSFMQGKPSRHPYYRAGIAFRSRVGLAPAAAPKHCLVLAETWLSWSTFSCLTAQIQSVEAGRPLRLVMNAGRYVYHEAP